MILYEYLEFCELKQEFVVLLLNDEEEAEADYGEKCNGAGTGIELDTDDSEAVLELIESAARAFMVRAVWNDEVAPEHTLEGFVAKKRAEKKEAASRDAPWRTPSQTPFSLTLNPFSAYNSISEGFGVPRSYFAKERV